MIKGFIEQRTTPRIPFEQDIQIRFMKDDDTAVFGKTVDISAGGLQFSISWGEDLFHLGDIIEIIFKDLPFIGDVTVASEIKYERPGIDPEYHRLNYFGAKFLNLSMDTWNAIIDYTRANPSSAQPVSLPKKETIERKDIRVTTCFNAEFKSSDNHYHPVIVEDLSFGGAKIKTPQPVAINDPMTLVLVNQDQRVEICGNCAWSGVEKDNRFVAGIFFNKLSLNEYNILRNIIFTALQ